MHENIVIKGEVVERVTHYKYLGVIFDERPDWIKNSEKVQSKVNQRVYFMYQVSKYKIDTQILSLFYDLCIYSVLTFCISAWGGNLRVKQKSIMDRSIKRCNKLLCKSIYIDMDQAFFISCQRKFSQIVKDSTHPLHDFIIFSNRTNRLIHMKAKTTRYFNSFLPFAIRHYWIFQSSFLSPNSNC